MTQNIQINNLRRQLSGETTDNSLACAKCHKGSHCSILKGQVVKRLGTATLGDVNRMCDVCHGGQQVSCGLSWTF